LVAHSFLTRSAALTVTAITGPSWDAAREWIMADIEDDLQVLGLTVLDAERLRSFRERMILSS
jgi:hypothetical protein